MFGSEILDIALGMIFVYLLLSLVASAIREGFESFIKARAVHLERGIRELLDDPTGDELARQLYQHPLVHALFRGEFEPSATRRTGGNLPTYIPSRVFATALMDLVAHGPGPYATGSGVSILKLRAALDAIPSDHVRRALSLAIDNGGNDLAKVQANLEQWFNDTMDRVSGWYRRRTQYGLFAVGAVLAVGINVDSVAVVNHLWRNRAAREALAARATAFVHDSATASRILSDPNRSRVLLNEQMAELDQLELPIGWRSSATSPSTVSGVLLKFFGLIVTMFAIALGAPFWFDALKRIMVIRSTVKPAESIGEKKGETPQGTTPTVPAASATPTAAIPPGGPSSPPATASPIASAAVGAANAAKFVPHRWAVDDSEDGLL